jgi:hypothetical protein
MLGELGTSWQWFCCVSDARGVRAQCRVVVGAVGEMRHLPAIMQVGKAREERHTGSNQHETHDHQHGSPRPACAPSLLLARGRAANLSAAAVLVVTAARAACTAASSTVALVPLL